MSNFILIWSDGINTHTVNKGTWSNENDPIEWVETEKVLNQLVAWYMVIDRQTGTPIYHAELNEVA